MRFTRVAAALVVLGSTSCFAAEIKMICTVGAKTAMEAIKPQFEKSTGHSLSVTYGTTVPLKRQIDAGETFDVVLLTPPNIIADLVKEGKVASETVVDVAKAGLGAAVRSGAPKPDLSSAASLRQALLASKAIVYSKEGASGAAMARTIEKLGIAEEMRPRTVYETRPGHAAVAVVEGKGDIGFALISEVLTTPGADFAGALPPDIQTYLVFAAGISKNAREREAAKALIDFIRTPAVLEILKSKGLEGA